jgi:phosphatidylglycerol:prolipoprotein diacylglycerol transferase
LTGYGLFRIFGEFFRQPDANIGYLYGGITEGQLLSIPMVAIGIVIIFMTLQKAKTKAP